MLLTYLEVTRSLIYTSDLWWPLCSRCDDEKLIKATRIDFEDWTHDDYAEAIEWAAKNDPKAPLPKKIAEHFSALKPDREPLGRGARGVDPVSEGVSDA